MSDSKPKTVRCRIALVVGPEGEWNSCGSNSIPDDEALGYAAEWIVTGEARYWVTVDVPIPDVREIEGTAEQDPHKCPACDGEGALAGLWEEDGGVFTNVCPPCKGTGIIWKPGEVGSE